jgi:hypothetical protein
MTRPEAFFSWGESWTLPAKTAPAALKGARRQERAGSLLVASHPRRPLGEWVLAEAFPERAGTSMPYLSIQRAGSSTRPKQGHKHETICRGSLTKDLRETLTGPLPCLDSGQPRGAETRVESPSMEPQIPDDGAPLP